MGYRSDVKMIITTDKKVITAEKLLKMLDADAKKELEDFGCKFKIAESGNIQKIYFQADYIKWYGDFKEIEAFNNWILKLQDFMEKHEHDGLGFHFVRMGENYDDLDEITAGVPLEYIHFFRYIEFENE